MSVCWYYVDICFPGMRLVVYYLWRWGVRGWRRPFWENLEDFQTNPQFILALWKWPPTNFRYCESNPLPDCCGNYEYSSYKSCRSSPLTNFIHSSVYKINVYNFRPLHAISIPSRYCFALLSWILLIKNNPSCNAPVSEKDPPKPIKIFKMTPQ